MVTSWRIAAQWPVCCCSLVDGSSATVERNALKELEALWTCLGGCGSCPTRGNETAGSLPFACCATPLGSLLVWRQAWTAKFPFCFLLCSDSYLYCLWP
uniref:Putative secreted protein n=1 Tax=Ixodes ricinus TaxID=34613 RepID=A0A6B0UE70_IXORI